jgi:hypothetical protein
MFVGTAPQTRISLRITKPITGASAKAQIKINGYPEIKQLRNYQGSTNPLHSPRRPKQQRKPKNDKAIRDSK